MVKIKVPLPPNATFGGEAEWIWADEKRNGLYRVRNVPFFAKGISYGDVIRAELEDGVLVFKDVSSRSGHSTYRIFASEGREQPAVIELIDQLKARHCTIEAGTPKLVAIDVLPEADIYDIYALLQRAEEMGTIAFDEGHCGHPLKA